MTGAQSKTARPGTARPAPSHAPSGERALRRMRIYTTSSLAIIVLLYCGVAIQQTQTVWLLIALLGTTVLVTAYAFYWEKAAPLWLVIPAFVSSLGVWVATVVVSELPTSIFLLAVTTSIYAFGGGYPRWQRAAAVGVAAGVVPLLVVKVVEPGSNIMPWLIGSAIAFVLALGLFGLNRYAFNLYLEIDDARRLAADLAVAEERYRFAADLHDIQGQTLHVIRLKTQLADRLLDRDPAAAHEHLREAGELIAQTLAGTRSLAFGERTVSSANELANAEALLTAAGIDFGIAGSLTVGEHDELFGLVVREATTNILRHAQASRVSVTLSPGSVTVTNDGSPAAARTLSGLARLGERIEAAGGTLSTSSTDGTFVTAASIR